jgi:TRAP transporter 4TM/12TM fusion protein
MGTAAFLMVDVAGIPYVEIAVAALIPALIYYFGIMMQVHYRSVVRNFRPLSDADQKQEKPLQVLKENIQYLIPVMVLIWLIAKRLNPTLVGLISAAVTVVVSWSKPGYRMGPKEIMQAIYRTGTGILTVANASAAAGMVIGGIMLTGLGGKFTSLVFQATGGNSLLCLMMVALVCIILGMGMPIPAAYVLTATLAAPALLEAGFLLLTSHLFIVYFSAMSALTPPVAVAAYAAAGIAGGNPNSTGFQAWAALMAASAVLAIASGLEGYLLRRLDSWVKRILLIAAGVVMFWPEVWSDVVGLGMLAGFLGWESRGVRVQREILRANKEESI